MQNIFKDIWNRLHELPEYPDFDTVGNLVDAYLSIPIDEHLNYKEDSLTLLAEISDKQWHTYECIDNERKIKLENFLLNFTHFVSSDEVELFFIPIGCFGLDNLYQKIKYEFQNNQLVYPKHVMETISEELTSSGENVKNPYDTLEKQIRESLQSKSKRSNPHG